MSRPELFDQVKWQLSLQPLIFDHRVSSQQDLYVLGRILQELMQEFHELLSLAQ